MTFRDFCFGMSAIFMFGGSAWYIYQALTKKVQAFLAAWIVLGGTLSLSLATYLTTSNPNLYENVCTVVSMASAVAILAILSILHFVRKDKIELNGKQRFSLSCAAVIATGWLIDVCVFHDKSVVPYVLTQALMLIGYFLNLSKLLAKTKNTDSFQLWIGICVSGIFSLYVAADTGNYLAWIASLRGIICSGITVYVMFRIEFFARKSGVRLATA